jgi:hypothetical protein
MLRTVGFSTSIPSSSEGSYGAPSVRTTDGRMPPVADFSAKALCAVGLDPCYPAAASMATANSSHALTGLWARLEPPTRRSPLAGPKMSARRFSQYCWMPLRESFSGKNPVDPCGNAGMLAAESYLKRIPGETLLHAGCTPVRGNNYSIQTQVLRIRCFAITRYRPILNGWHYRSGAQSAYDRRAIDLYCCVSCCS